MKMAETKKGSTFTKHYYSETFEDQPHYTAEITVDEDATISEMCRAFELFLKVSGYVFDGVVDIVPHESEYVDETMDSKRDPYGVPTGVVPKVHPPRWAVEPDRNSVFDERM